MEKVQDQEDIMYKKPPLKVIKRPPTTPPLPPKPPGFAEKILSGQYENAELKFSSNRDCESDMINIKSEPISLNLDNESKCESPPVYDEVKSPAPSSSPSETEINHSYEEFYESACSSTPDEEDLEGKELMGKKKKKRSSLKKHSSSSSSCQSPLKFNDHKAQTEDVQVSTTKPSPTKETIEEIVIKQDDGPKNEEKTEEKIAEKDLEEARSIFENMPIKANNSENENKSNEVEQIQTTTTLNEKEEKLEEELDKLMDSVKNDEYNLERDILPIIANIMEADLKKDQNKNEELVIITEEEIEENPTSAPLKTIVEQNSNSNSPNSPKHDHIILPEVIIINKNPIAETKNSNSSKKAKSVEKNSTPKPNKSSIIHHFIELPPIQKSSFFSSAKKSTMTGEANSNLISSPYFQKSQRLNQLMLTHLRSQRKIRSSSVSSTYFSSEENMNGNGDSFRKKSRMNLRRVNRSASLIVSRNIGRVRRRVGSIVNVRSPILGIRRIPFIGSHHSSTDRPASISNKNREIGVESDKKDGIFNSNQGQNEFEELRRHVKLGGTFCQDLSAVLQERSELEAQYAKGLAKLSAKLLKASKESTGSIMNAWQGIGVSMSSEAEIHKLWSTVLSEELAKNLKNSTDTQHKIRKSVEGLVEKTTRNLADWRLAESKSKKQCFQSAKEFEKLQEASSLIINNTNISTTTTTTTTGGNPTNNTNPAGNNNPGVVRSRLLSVPSQDNKDPIKLESKIRKAEEMVKRNDFEYYTFCTRSERARLEWESSIRNGSKCLRTLEEEKLSLMLDLVTKYYQHLNELTPKLIQTTDALYEPIKGASVENDMHSIIDIRRHSGAEQLLPDFYAEDLSNLMNKDRRLEALQKLANQVQQDLEREKKGSLGIEKVAKEISEGPKIVDNSHHDISDKLYYVKSMLLYLESTRCKLDNVLCDVDGKQRKNYLISQYTRHQRDKQGLPQTILKVPTWARDDCLSSSTANGTISGSDSPDWTDSFKDRGTADGNSNQQEDFGEFSSSGGSSENIEVFDETDNINKVPKFDPAPSIGTCKAIYDYDANMNDELTIRIGDQINIHDKQEDGWMVGELNGVVGLFPASYVEEIES